MVGVERGRTAGRSVGCIKLEYGMKSDWVGHGWARVRSVACLGLGFRRTASAREYVTISIRPSSLMLTSTAEGGASLDARHSLAIWP